MTKYTQAQTNTQIVLSGKIQRGNFLLLQLILNMCHGLYCNLQYETEKGKHTSFAPAFMSRFIYGLAWSSEDVSLLCCDVYNNIINHLPW